MIVWVWNSNRARLGDSDALNGIARGHWVMFSLAAGLVCRGQGSFTHVQARLGFGSLSFSTWSVQHHGQREWPSPAS